MKSLYASFDTIFLGYLEGLLRSEGIAAEIRNQYLAGAFGELPPNDVMPELWVEKAKYDWARQLINEVLGNHNAPELPDWQCPECGEQVEGQFGQCWHCGHIKQ